MSFETIKQAAWNWTKSMIAKNITVEMVRNFLTATLVPVKKRAAENSVEFDEWAIEALESIIADDSRMTVLVQWVKSKVSGEKICMNSECELKEFEELAVRLSSKDGECGSASWVTVLAGFLETVLPILIEWLSRKEEETK